MNTRLVRDGTRWLSVGLIVAGLPLSACRATPATSPSKSQPAKVETIEGTNLSRVRLSERAAERLGIQTATVRDTPVVRKRKAEGEAGGAPRKVIPYAAVLYDPQGDTWTYVNPQPLVFVRERISVDYIEGDVAVLSDGPPTGTAVVTVGAPELFGAELGVGH